MASPRDQYLAQLKNVEALVEQARTLAIRYYGSKPGLREPKDDFSHMALPWELGEIRNHPFDPATIVGARDRLREYAQAWERTRPPHVAAPARQGAEAMTRAVSFAKHQKLFQRGTTPLSRRIYKQALATVVGQVRRPGAPVAVARPQQPGVAPGLVLAGALAAFLGGAALADRRRRGSGAQFAVQASPQGVQIEVNPWGVTLTAAEHDELWEVFDQAGVSQYHTDHAVAVARDEDGDFIGGITADPSDEITIAVLPDRQKEGIGGAMLTQLVAAGGGGYMVAGTQAGAGFIASLPGRFGGFPQQLDVPSWQQQRRMWQQQRQGSGAVTSLQALMEQAQSLTMEDLLAQAQALPPPPQRAARAPRRRRTAQVPPALAPFMAVGKRVLRNMYSMKPAGVRYAHPISGIKHDFSARNRFITFDQRGTMYLSDGHMAVPATKAVPLVENAMAAGGFGGSREALFSMLRDDPASISEVNQALAKLVDTYPPPEAIPPQRFAHIMVGAKEHDLGMPALALISDRGLLDTFNKPTTMFPSVVFTGPTGKHHAIQGPLLAAAVEAVGSPWRILAPKDPTSMHKIVGPKGTALVMPMRLGGISHYELVSDYTPPPRAPRKAPVALPQAQASAQAASVRPYRTEARAHLRNLAKFNAPRVMFSFYQGEPYLTDGTLAIPMLSPLVEKLAKDKGLSIAQLQQRFTRDEGTAYQLGEQMRSGVSSRHSGQVMLPAKALASVMRPGQATPIPWPDFELVGEKVRQGRRTKDTRILVFAGPRERMGVHPVNLAAVLHAVGTPVQLYASSALAPVYLEGPRGLGVLMPVRLD